MVVLFRRLIYILGPSRVYVILGKVVHCMGELTCVFMRGTRWFNRALLGLEFFIVILRGEWRNTSGPLLESRLILSGWRSKNPTTRGHCLLRLLARFFQ